MDASVAEEIEQCREAVRSKLQQRQNQVADLNEVQSLLMKLERCAHIGLCNQAKRASCLVTWWIRLGHVKGLISRGGNWPQCIPAAAASTGGN